jgi:hypothetical protein
VQLYTYDEVIADVQQNNLSLPKMPNCAESRLFIRLFSAYAEQVKRCGGILSEYHNLHMVPNPDVIPDTSFNYWVYWKPHGQERMVLDFQSKSLSEVLRHTDKAWPHNACESVYIVMVRGLTIIHFGGRDLYEVMPKQPTNITK